MFIKLCSFSRKYYSTTEILKLTNNQKIEADSFTNLTPNIISLLNRKLYVQKYHPICLIKERIIQFFNKKFLGPQNNSVFSVHDSLNPVVTVEKNFDSLLVPVNHPSRSKNDCYYLNKDLMLRAHMTAHQSELIKMGFNNFIMIGDVFRRDSIDSTHYPVFHQLDAVRLHSSDELFAEKGLKTKDMNVIEKSNCSRTKCKQEMYTLEATSKVEIELKSTLEELSKELFGQDIHYKWVEAHFPFTHPSWEMEIFFKEKWIEVLGCGIIEHEILRNGGCPDKIGWAFGLGLERLAMLYYSIPDIRLFWTNDSGFHYQFQGKNCSDKIEFKPFSIYPAAPFDISFWVNENFKINDFYKIVNEVCNNNVEQVQLIDKYFCKKTQRESYCFRIVYRSMEKTFTKEEVRIIHSLLAEKLTSQLNVVIR